MDESAVTSLTVIPQTGSIAISSSCSVRFISGLSQSLFVSQCLESRYNVQKFFCDCGLALSIVATTKFSEAVLNVAFSRLHAGDKGSELSAHSVITWGRRDQFYERNGPSVGYFAHAEAAGGGRAFVPDAIYT